jgi:hypothetical protein
VHAIRVATAHFHLLQDIEYPSIKKLKSVKQLNNGETSKKDVSVDKSYWSEVIYSDLCYVVCPYKGRTYLE